MVHITEADLPENIARIARAQVQSGRFASIEEVLWAGVEALSEREEAQREWLSYARESWRQGVESIARDGAVEMNEKQFSAFLDSCLQAPSP